METHATPRRPGGLTAICVIAMVLGGLGLLGGLAGAVTIAFGPQMQNAFTPPQRPGVPQPALDAQQDMNREIQAVAERWKVANIASVLVGLLVSACLLGGAIGSLKLKSGGRKLLIGAALGGILFAVGSVTLQFFVQQETRPITKNYMGKIMDAPQQGQKAPPQAGKVMQATMEVMMIATMIFMFVWGLAKIAFYVVVLTYLGKSSVAALFDRGFGQPPGEQPFGAPPGYQ